MIRIMYFFILLVQKLLFGLTVNFLTPYNMIFMKTIVSNTKNIAACGLYCGACRKFLTEKCPGCKQNEKATWCKIRQCCIERGYRSCADCIKNVKVCKIHNNMIGKIFAFLFNSDRVACIRYIQTNGYEAFAKEMTRRKAQTMKRR